MRNVLKLAAQVASVLMLALSLAASASAQYAVNVAPFSGTMANLHMYYVEDYHHYEMWHAEWNAAEATYGPALEDAIAYRDGLAAQWESLHSTALPSRLMLQGEAARQVDWMEAGLLGAEGLAEAALLSYNQPNLDARAALQAKITYCQTRTFRSESARNAQIAELQTLLDALSDATFAFTSATRTYEYAVMWWPYGAGSYIISHPPAQMFQEATALVNGNASAIGAEL